MFKSINFKQDIYNKLIFLYVLLDFLVTYLGINYFGCLTEANPLLSWLFELPFAQALFIRIIFASTIYFMYRFIQNNTVSTYKKMVVFAILLESFVMILHIRWLILYLAV